MMFLWFIILGVLFYFLFSGNIDMNFKKNSPENELDIRLAKGEIDIEEYREIKRTLKENEWWIFLKWDLFY